MSRKNHKMIDGRLLQTNKKYSQLKMKQKEKIAEWMFQATRDYYMKKCTFPSDKHLEEVDCHFGVFVLQYIKGGQCEDCLLYTSDAADE